MSLWSHIVCCLQLGVPAVSKLCPICLVSMNVCCSSAVCHSNKAHNSLAIALLLCYILYGMLQVRREMMAQASGVVIPRILPFDGNIITPGTPFMANLARHLRQYLQQKAATDPAWQHLQVQSHPPHCFHIPWCISLWVCIVSMDDQVGIPVSQGNCKVMWCANLPAP